jgi:hypothetical protein
LNYEKKNGNSIYFLCFRADLSGLIAASISDSSIFSQGKDFYVDDLFTDINLDFCDSFLASGCFINSINKFTSFFNLLVYFLLHLLAGFITLSFGEILNWLSFVISQFA